MENSSEPLSLVSGEVGTTQKRHLSHVTRNLNPVLVLPDTSVGIVNHHSRFLARNRSEEHHLLYALQAPPLARRPRQESSVGVVGGWGE